MTGGASISNSQSFGTFGPRPQLEWLDDGRDMQLLRPFSFTDPRGKIWTAELGKKVNGASIPSILWSFVGGPFEGKYRNASVVHDTECAVQLRDWRDVHRMFYEGVRAGGVGWVKGKLMYAAVYFFGPRWKSVTSTPQVSDSEAHEFLTRMLVLIRRDPVGLQLSQIESESMASLRSKVPDSDPDLAVVRGLLEERNSLQNRVPSNSRHDELIRNIEDRLYREDRTIQPSPPAVTIG
jgi:hypothetical protein